MQNCKYYLCPAVRRYPISAQKKNSVRNGFSEATYTINGQCSNHTLDPHRNEFNDIHSVQLYRCVCHLAVPISQRSDIQRHYYLAHHLSLLVPHPVSLQTLRKTQIVKFFSSLHIGPQGFFQDDMFSWEFYLMGLYFLVKRLLILPSLQGVSTFFIHFIFMFCPVETRTKDREEEIAHHNVNDFKT